MFFANEINETKVNLTWQYSSRSPEVNYTVDLDKIKRPTYLDECKRDWLIRVVEKTLKTVAENLILGLPDLMVKWPQGQKPILTQNGMPIDKSKQDDKFQKQWQEYKRLKAVVADWCESERSIELIMCDIIDNLDALYAFLPSIREIDSDDFDETLLALQNWVDAEQI